VRKALDLLLERMEEGYVRKALENLTNWTKKQPFMEPEWQFFEKEYTAAVNGDLVAHTLGGVPKDIILTSKIGAGSVTFEYADFTSQFIVVSVTGPVKVRFFAATYIKG
jgi:hypothetical protein